MSLGDDGANVTVNMLLCGFAVKVLDVGHNKLLNVSVKNLMSSPISLFDMTMNSQMKINELDYKAVRCRMWFYQL